MTAQTAPWLTFCADPHPLDPAVLCRRLDGHSGLHGADEELAWEDEIRDVHTLACAMWTTNDCPCDCGAGEQR